jgi:hypothetical protein
MSGLIQRLEVKISGLFCFFDPRRADSQENPLFLTWIVALVLLINNQIAVAMGN